MKVLFEKISFFILGKNFDKMIKIVTIFAQIFGVFNFLMDSKSDSSFDDIISNFINSKN